MDTEDLSFLARLPGMAYHCRNDADWTMLRVSAGALALTGYPPSHFLSGRHTYAELIHPEDRARVWEQIQSALAGQHPFDLEYRLCLADGRIRPVIEHGQAANNAGVDELVGFVFDATHAAGSATDLPRMQAAVLQMARDPGLAQGDIDGMARRLTALVAELLAVARVAVWLFNDERTALQPVCLYDRYSGQYQSPSPLLAAECPDYLSALNAGRILRVDDALGHAVTAELRAAYLRPLDIRSLLDAPIRSGGEVLGILCVEQTGSRRYWDANDIALVTGMADQLAQVLMVRQRREAEVSVTRALAHSEAKSRFLAVMSHEIRTPMTGVLGMIDLLEDTTLNAYQKHYLALMKTSARHLMGVLDEVLDIARIEESRLVFYPQVFDLPAMLHGVVAFFAGQVPRPGLDLDCTLAAGVPERVCMDEGRLRQILMNLLGNALKFTESGTVSVRADTATDGRQLVLEVADTGIGIDPALIESLFQPFEQHPEQSQRHRGGTGLGLAISRALAELMGGSLSASSTPGHGSVFRLVLPLLPLADCPPALPVTAAGADTASLAGLRVLVVEDNPINQQVIAALLAREDVGCRIFASGEAVLASLAVHAEPVDLILMDCELPGLSGAETTARIRADGPHRDCYVVALSAHALREYREQARQAGMDDYLSKPVQREALLAVLHEAARRRLAAAAS